LRHWRLFFLLLILIAALSGITSRTHPEFYPLFLQVHLGDAAWALAAYSVVGLLTPRRRPELRIAIAFLLAAGVEFSQLWQAPWLTTIRQSQAGRWFIGTGFLWIDFLRYLGGILAAYGIERIFRMIQHKR